jgi:YihY family inner membrane protein
VSESSRSRSSFVDRLQRRFPKYVRDVIRQAQGKDIFLFSAGLSFYALVSIVPLIIVVMWLGSLILGDDSIKQLADSLDDLAPNDLGIGHLLHRVADLGTSLGLVALVTALWPASSYGAGLRRAFDRMSPRKPREMKGFKGRALALLVLLPVFVLGSLIGSYAGTALLGEGVVLRIIGFAVALITGFVATAVGVVLILRIFPPDPLPRRSILHGTVFSAATISVLSLLFTVFVILGADFEQHYATSGVAGIVLVGVWLFFANALLLLGYLVALDT